MLLTMLVPPLGGSMKNNGDSENVHLPRNDEMRKPVWVEERHHGLLIGEDGSVVLLLPPAVLHYG